MQSNKYKCPVDWCDYTTESSRGLSVHKTKTHDGVSYVDTECNNCGAVLSRKKSELSKTGNAFCDQECYKSWNTGDNHPNNKKKISLECEFCGDSYEVYPYRADDSRFCSQECSGKYKTEQGTEQVSCDWCDDTFRKAKRSINRSDHNFCSKACYGEWSSLNKNGQNHPNWTGGQNLYEAIRENLSDEPWSRIAELNRANSCYKCGKQGGELHEHHIVPVMYGGTNADALLMTLCPSCHRTTESYTMRTLETNIMEVA